MGPGELGSGSGLLGCVWGWLRWGLGLGCWVVLGTGVSGVWVLAAGLCLGLVVLYGSLFLGLFWGLAASGAGSLGCLGLAILGYRSCFLGCIGVWLHWGLGLGSWDVCGTRCIGVWVLSVGLFGAVCIGAQISFFGSF